MASSPHTSPWLSDADYAAILGGQQCTTPPAPLFRVPPGVRHFLEAGVHRLMASSGQGVLFLSCGSVEKEEDMRDLEAVRKEFDQSAYKHVGLDKWEQQRAAVGKPAVVKWLAKGARAPNRSGGIIEEFQVLKVQRLLEKETGVQSLPIMAVRQAAGQRVTLFTTTAPHTFAAGAAVTVSGVHPSLDGTHICTGSQDASTFNVRGLPALSGWKYTGTGANGEGAATASNLLEKDETATLFHVIPCGRSGQIGSLPGADERCSHRSAPRGSDCQSTVYKSADSRSDPSQADSEEGRRSAGGMIQSPTAAAAESMAGPRPVDLIAGARGEGGGAWGGWGRWMRGNENRAAQGVAGAVATRGNDPAGVEPRAAAAEGPEGGSGAGGSGEGWGARRAEPHWRQDPMGIGGRCGDGRCQTQVPAEEGSWEDEDDGHTESGPSGSGISERMDAGSGSEARNIYEPEGCPSGALPVVVIPPLMLLLRVQCGATLESLVLVHHMTMMPTVKQAAMQGTPPVIGVCISKLQAQLMVHGNLLEGWMKGWLTFVEEALNNKEGEFIMSLPLCINPGHLKPDLERDAIWDVRQASLRGAESSDCENVADSSQADMLGHLGASTGGELPNYEQDIIQQITRGGNHVLVGSPESTSNITAETTRNLLEHSPLAHVFFIASEVAVAKKQAESLEERGFATVEALTVKKMTREKWGAHYEQNSLQVMTAQLLLNALNQGWADWSQVCMLVLGKCHLASGDHPYAKVVESIKSNAQDRVQVLATTDVNPQDTVRMAIVNALKEELDAVILYTSELGQAATACGSGQGEGEAPARSKCEGVRWPIDRRTEDEEFKRMLGSFLQEAFEQYTSFDDLEPALAPAPATTQMMKGEMSTQVDEWAGRLIKKARECGLQAPQIEDMEAFSELLCLVNFSIGIVDEVGYELAVDDMLDSADRLEKGRHPSGWFWPAASSLRCKLECYGAGDAAEFPKIRELIQQLVKYKDAANFHGVVVTKTRHCAQHLSNTIGAIEDLGFLTTIIFCGHNKVKQRCRLDASLAKGLTKTQQAKRLDDFKSASHCLLFAPGAKELESVHVVHIDLAVVHSSIDMEDWRRKEPRVAKVVALMEEKG
ncbi:unnamed protein product [Ostreobium quekettii]|uniref:Uncharacterized protein n=1 Tax=Ostreobium quekettii TaxID=121088 RepID=A0A8S1J8T2_9CHLO|nr:unnamed protein product [Ostreobium quekettii]